MLQRSLFTTLKKDLAQVPAVVLFGPRQVGKTTLAKQLAIQHPDDFVYLDMELPSDRAKLTDIELFLTPLQDKTVIIDEVQLLPPLFPVLRALIDQHRKPGRFLLLGSASPDLLQKSSESLAGRVRYREVFPLTLQEAGGPSSLRELWFRGGFPNAFLSTNAIEAMAWHTDFIRTYAARDLALLGLPMPSAQIERLLQMLAHLHGQLVNYSQLANALGVSQPTVTNALHYFEEAMLIRTLQPWHANSKKRIIKSPKVYIRDSGMLHELLRLQSYQQLLGHPQAGASWEGFVIQQLLATFPGEWQPYFYRTSGGAEIDLLLVHANQIKHAVEIKLTTAPHITRGNTEAIADLEPEQCMIIASVDEMYPLKAPWKVYNLPGFLEKIQKGS